MKKLLLALALLLCGFTQLPGNLPVRMEIASTYFSIDTSGIVPDKEGAITQFAPGVFLAHNYLSGKYFTGDNVFITYSDGSRIEYGAVEMFVLQALPQTDGSTLYSDGKILYTDADIFLKIFNRGDITLATCYNNGDAISWGRKFIVMKELSNAR
jgi:hypothetical protein